MSDDKPGVEVPKTDYDIFMMFKKTVYYTSLSVEQAVQLEALLLRNADLFLNYEKLDKRINK